MPVALLYAGGILISNLFFVSPFFLLLTSLSLVLITLMITSGRPWLLCLLIVLCGWTNAVLRTAVISPYDIRTVLGDGPNLGTIRGTLSETPSLRIFEQDEKPSWRTMARIDVAEIRLAHKTWQPVKGRIAVTTPTALTNFFGGQKVEVIGVIALPKIAAAEGLFDYRAYLKQLGIYYQLHASSEEDWTIISPGRKPPLADRFRTWAKDALARGLPCEDEALRLEWALTLGWKTAFTEQVEEPFVRAATYHIFAVDGLRMAIIFGIFFGLFRAIGLPRAYCAAALIPLIWFYTALTGWPASAIRATVMLTVLILGWIFKRPSDLINSLFAAALIILLWQPQQLFQAGFQLSFLVVLCIILIMPMLQGAWERLTAPDPLLPPALHRRWPAFIHVPTRFIVDTLLTSGAAWIGALPLVAYYFHIVSPVSTPANLVAVPLCAVCLMSNLGSLLLAAWFPAAAELFNHAGWFLMESIRVTSLWFASWPHAYYYAATPTLFGMGLYYAILITAATGWLFRSSYRAWKFSALAVAVAIWGLAAWRAESSTQLHVLPVTGGVTIYSAGPRAEERLLVDCGTTNGVAFLTKPFLRAQGVNRLPNLALTHGDLHHVGGAKDVVDLFSVREVWISPVRFRSTAYRQVVNDLSAQPNLVHKVTRNDLVAGWTVLHPEKSDRFAQADDNAMVLSKTICGTRILLLSDLGRLGQEALKERTSSLQADIVVTGIPVRPEAISDSILEEINPRIIVVADSEFPVSERAPKALCSRLAQYNVPVIYTRLTGAVVFTFQQQTWELRAMNGLSVSARSLPRRSASLIKTDPLPAE